MKKKRKQSRNRMAITTEKIALVTAIINVISQIIQIAMAFIK